MIMLSLPMLARYVHSCGPDTTSALQKTQLYHTKIAGKQFFAETKETAEAGKYLDADSAEDSNPTNKTTTTTTTTAPSTATTTTTTAATATTSNTSSTSKTSSDNALGEGGGEGDGINFF